MTFEVIDALLASVSHIFPDAYVHMSGDEVRTECWTKTPSIAAWLKEHNMNASDACKTLLRSFLLSCALGRAWLSLIPFRWLFCGARPQVSACAEPHRHELGGGVQ